MKKITKAIGLMLIAGTFYSCSPVPYAVIGHNTPLLQTKDEVNLNAALASTDHASGLQLQTAWAFDSSWAIISSFYTMKSEGSWDEPEQWNGKEDILKSESVHSEIRRVNRTKKGK